MNTGTIASRYATALLKLTSETGRGEQVCAQILQMLRNPESVPTDLEPDLSKFIVLLSKKGRLDYLKFIFVSYIKRYYASNGIKFVHLVSASPSQELEKRVSSIVASASGSKVVMDTVTDPSIIGGFIINVDDLRLDASVKGQLNLLRNRLVTNNNRLV